MAKYRFKTREEFKKEGLWDTSCDAPKGWASSKSMNKYLGQEIPEDYNHYCDDNTRFTGPDGWTFQSSDYVAIVSLVGRYIKYAKYNPGTSSSGYEKIIQDNPLKETVELEHYGGCARSRLTDGDFTLMPVGWIPPFSKENYVGRWVKWNVSAAGHGKKYKKGDYSKIKTIFAGAVNMEGDIFNFTDARLTDGDWEIMPEGFTPPSATDFPDKWAVKVDGPSSQTKYAELSKWRKHSWTNSGYIHSDEWHRETVKEGFTEITLDQFLENVWKKPLLKLPTSTALNSVDSNLAIKCSNEEQSKRVFAKLKSLGEKKDSINLTFGPTWCYIYYKNEGSYNGWLLGRLSDIGRKKVISAAEFLAESIIPDTTTSSSSSIGLKGMDSYALSRFPASGYYKLSNPKSDEVIKVLQQQYPGYIADREARHTGVAWNGTHFWFVVGASGKTEYSYAYLSPFLDTQSSESSSPEVVSSSDVPKFIKDKWYKNLGGSQNYAGCFDYLEDNEKFYMKSYYDFHTKQFSKTSGWLHCKNAVECTEEDLKIIFALNPTQNPMYVKPIPEYVKGKWYHLKQWGYQSFIKFDYLNDRRAYYTECIHDGKHKEKSDWWSTSGNTLEVPSMQEVFKYLPEGHPDKIIPKIEFIPGKWYTGFSNKDKIAAKFLRSDDEFFHFSEFIRKKECHKYYKGNWRLELGIVELTDLSIIQDYLPPGHPEKYPEYYEYIDSSGLGFTKGKIYKIKNPANFEEYHNFIDDKGNPNGFSGTNFEHFKPSTKEAFDAQKTPEVMKTTSSVSGINLNTFIKAENALEASLILDYLKAKGEKVARCYSWGKESWSYIGYRKTEDAWSVTELYNHNNFSLNPFVVKGEDFLPKSVSTCPFKVGDKIIGKSKGVYGITDEGWIGEVIKIYNSEHVDIEVQGIGRFERGPFEVHSKHFRIATSTEISLSSVEKKKTSTESIINVAKGDLPQTIKVKDRPII